MKQILHTPEGVRDIYGMECIKKHTVEKELLHTMHLYGYHDIQTPTFEFFDVFSKEIGTTPSRELYKFFDRDGNTLVMRPDMTPSIARACATIFDVENKPARLCYKGSTFINHSNYRGKLRENTQAGVELVGSGGVEADAEMVSLAVECLKAVGLKEFQIAIGNVDFFQSLVSDAALEDEAKERLLELIANRNYFGVDELLEEADAKKTSKRIFQILPELVGGVEVLEVARRIAPNQKALDAIIRLHEMYDLLVAYGVEEFITFDLSMNASYEYYTGIIFRGYTYGTGDSIVKGGRYDKLLAKFGKDAPSIGFAIVIDELVGAINRQKLTIPFICKNALVLYDECREGEAISLASDFRKKGKCTELIKYDKDYKKDSYLEYAKNAFCETVLYLKATGEIEISNLTNGKMKVVTSKISK